ncbi:MAG: DUF1080 domain-containing protein [Chlorobia bacterium]|nr:DUF1080 domain-containing protein [Fimbriimonadaceae bacterium]
MIAALTALVLFQAANTLTPEESKAGWRLLFDGKSTAGWKNFKSDTIRPGWQVKDGVLTSVDPNNAGDIVTKDKFEWFELTLDYNLTKGGNSGVLFHVADNGGATWHSGPEVQLYDHWVAEGVETSGFLYQLYPSKVDAAKPAGEWNKLRLMIAPDKCFTEINGQRYYEFVLGSDDYKSRIAKSKFKEFPNFGTLGKGSIAIQGDHGVVSFRNMKIRELKK